MKRLFRNRKSDGAASIIVVFMIMVLFVFGMLSLTTGVANLRLSRKGAAWNTDYYALEKAAEEYLFELDALLLSAEQSARDSLYTLRAPQGADAAFYQDAFVRYYYYYASSNLAKLPPENVDEAVLHADQYINTDKPLAQMALPLVYLDFTLDDTKHLLVGVQAVCPAYDITLSGASPQGQRKNPLDYRYEIIEWREWQQPFDYNQPEEFWDGQINVD